MPNTPTPQQLNTSTPQHLVPGFQNPPFTDRFLPPQSLETRSDAAERRRDNRRRRGSSGGEAMIGGRFTNLVLGILAVDQATKLCVARWLPLDGQQPLWSGMLT